MRKSLIATMVLGSVFATATAFADYKFYNASASCHAGIAGTAVRNLNSFYVQTDTSVNGFCPVILDHNGTPNGWITASITVYDYSSTKEGSCELHVASANGNIDNYSTAASGVSYTGSKILPTSVNVLASGLYFSYIRCTFPSAGSMQVNNYHTYEHPVGATFN